MILTRVMPRTSRISSTKDRGFTLLETSVALFIGLLLVIAALSLLLLIGRATTRVSAGAATVQSGAIVVQSVNTLLEEGFGTILPDDSLPTWNSATLGDLTLYQSTSGATTINTALYLLLPPEGSAEVYDSAGNAITLSGTASPFNRSGKNITHTMLLFRGTESGAAAPSNGNCLWFWEYQGGAVVQRYRLSRTIAPVWNAVQFRRQGENLIYIQLVTGTNLPSGAITSENTGSGAGVLNSTQRAVRLHNVPLGKGTTITYPSGVGSVPSAP